MCGIVGFIGEPKDRKVCFDLTTALLAKTETRGDDASGYWSTESKHKDDEENVILFSKEPKQSTEFVKSSMWQEWGKRNVNLLISHCRRSTVKGSENRNINNHPFRSESWRTALVHNGNVPEFDALRTSYDVQSQCDSEILLRMMERGIQYNSGFLQKWLAGLKADDGKLITDLPQDKLPVWVPKLAGLMDIFARINYGAMAVAIGEKWLDGTRALWLFRDKERPLHVIDMRKTLNQVYIVSEKKIWRDAVEATHSCRRFVKPNTGIIEFPDNFIWLLTLGPKGELGVRKWHITRKRMLNTTFEEERPELLTVVDTAPPPIVVTNLECESHEVADEKPSLAQNGANHQNGKAATKKERRRKKQEQKRDSKKKKKEGTNQTQHVMGSSSHTTPGSRTPMTRSNLTLQDTLGDSRRISEDDDDPYADLTPEQRINARRVFDKYRDKINKWNQDRTKKRRIRPILELLSINKGALSKEENEIRADYIKTYARVTTKTPKSSVPPPVPHFAPPPDPVIHDNPGELGDDYHPFTPQCQIPRIKDNSMSQSSTSVDQAEIDRLYDLFDACTKYLSGIETSMKHLIKSDTVRPQEVMETISSLEDIRNDLRATQTVVDNLPITA